MQLSPNSRHHILSFPLLLPPLSSPVLEPNLMIIIIVNWQQTFSSNLNPLLLELDSFSQHLPLNNIWVVGAQESRLQLEYENSNNENLFKNIWLYLSKLSFRKNCPMPPFPARQREPWPGREEGGREAEVRREWAGGEGQGAGKKRVGSWRTEHQIGIPLWIQSQPLIGWAK